MATLVDIHGNPLVRDALKTPQTVAQADIQRLYPEHPSLGLNIRKMPRILQAAEQGDLSAQAHLFADMQERDGHIFAEMNKRKNALLTLSWSIVPPLNATADEKNMTAAVQDWFSSIPEMEDVILNLMDAVGHGFSCQEIDWELSEKIWLPRSLHLRPHYWFSTLPEKGDQLRLNDGSMEGSELWPFGWLVHRHNARSGFVATSGIYRVLVWPYLFKNYALRDWAEFLEIYGLPARIATYAAGTTDEERDRILAMLVRLGHEAVAVLPQGTDIKFENAASGGSDPFTQMIRWAELTESKVILGGTLTTQADGKTSTNALGNVHNEVRHDLMTADARQIEGAFRQLIFMLLTLNGYSNVSRRRLPRLMFDTREVVDLTPLTTAVSVMVNELGMDTIPVAWLHEKSGIPVAAKGDAVLKPIKQTGVTATQALSTLAIQRIAALSQQTDAGHDDDPAQLSLDDTAPSVDTVSTAMEKLMAPMVAALSQGKTPDEATEIVAASFPLLDDNALRGLVGQALFVADVWGRLNGNT
jgi:phage gp29-like protein